MKMLIKVSQANSKDCSFFIHHLAFLSCQCHHSVHMTQHILTLLVPLLPFGSFTFNDSFLSKLKLEKYYSMASAISLDLVSSLTSMYQLPELPLLGPSQHI